MLFLLPLLILIGVILLMQVMRLGSALRDVQHIIWAVIALAHVVLEGSCGNLGCCYIWCLAVLFPVKVWGLERTMVTAILLLMGVAYRCDGVVSALCMYGMFCMHYLDDSYDCDVRLRVFLSCTLLTCLVIVVGFMAQSFDWHVTCRYAWALGVLVGAVLMWAGVYPVPHLVAFSQKKLQGVCMRYWLGGALLLAIGVSLSDADQLAFYFILNAIFLFGGYLTLFHATYDLWNCLMILIWIWGVFALLLVSVYTSMVGVALAYLFGILLWMRYVPQRLIILTGGALLCGMAAFHPVWYGLAVYDTLPTYMIVLWWGNIAVSVMVGARVAHTHLQHISELWSHYKKNVLVYYAVTALASALFYVAPLYHKG